MNDVRTIKQQFAIDGHVASTRSADLYRAQNLETNDQVLLWSLRYPLQNGQWALERLTHIKNLELPEVPVLEANIDADGILYSVHPTVALLPIKNKLSAKPGKVDAREAERRFVPCLKIISDLHSSNISCGDISDASFLTDRGGKVFFLGVLGTHDGFASGTAVLPPLETLSYMAPEQRTGGELSKQTDVFALGVLAYELFTGASPWDESQLIQGTLGKPRLPSSWQPTLPAWVDKALLRALAVDPDDRFMDASQFIQAIHSYRNEAPEDKKSPPKSSAKNDVDKKAGTTSLPAFGFGVTAEEEEVLEEEKPVDQELERLEAFSKKKGVEGTYDASVPKKSNEKADMLEAAAPKAGSGVRQKPSKMRPQELSKADSLQLNKPITMKKQFDKTKIALFAGIPVLFIVTFAAAFIFIKKMSASAPKPATEAEGGGEANSALMQHREATNDLRMKLAIDTLSDKSDGIDKKIAGIHDLANSDDPLVHEVLLTSALQATSAEQRTASEQAIIARTKRLGYGRTAEQLRLWLRAHQYPEIPERYESIVRAINPFLSLEQATPLLKNVYAGDAGLALRLTVARALDSNNPDAYDLLLREFVGDQRGLTEPAKGTWATIILEEMDLAVVFGEDALSVIGKSDTESLKQLTLRLASRNDSMLQPIAKILTEKNELDSASQSIMGILSQRDDLPIPLQAVLARMALNAATEQDFVTFSQWVSPESEKVLYGLAALGTNATDAIELLAGRNIQDRPMSVLIERVRSAFWEKRADLAQAIGVFGLRANMSNDRLEQAVSKFTPISEDKKILSALLGLGNEVILQSVIKLFPGKVGFGALLRLLESDQPKIRIMAVHSLKAFNDVSALKLILEYYDKEKDESVRQAYRDTFWNLADKN